MKIVNIKRKLKIALIIFGAIVFVWYGFVGVVKYKNWKWVEGMKNEAAKFEKEVADKGAKIVADTYGGKTPQETLEMFIAAVEKGDYELASKYFVVEKREKWKKDLTEVKNLDFLMGDLIKIEKKLFAMPRVNFDTVSTYTISDPVFITFIKYPSNLWKINEI